MATTKELLAEATKLNDAEDYKGVIALLPDDVLLQHANAALYSWKGHALHMIKEEELSLVVYKQAIALDEGNKDHHYNLGVVYYELKRYDEAIAAYKKAIELGVGISHPYNGLGNVYRALKRYDEAIATYKRAIELDKGISDPYNGLGNVYYDLKRYDEAIAAYTHAIKIDSSFDSSYYNRALVYYDQEQYAGALDDFKKYIEVTKDKDDRFYYYAQEKIDELSKLILAPDEMPEAVITDNELPLYAADDTPKAATADNKNLTNIGGLIRKIKEKLKYTGDPTVMETDERKGEQMYVTHYTTFAGAKAMLLGKSPLRLSEGAFLNDTSEGKALFSFLSGDDGLMKEPDHTAVELFKSRYFIGSYVPGSLHDDLTLWRTYAKDDNHDAKGCSITYDSNELIEHIKKKLKEASSPTDEDDYAFYRVAYRKVGDTSQQFRIPNGNKDPDIELNKNLNHLLDELKKEVTAYLNVKAKSTKEIRREHVRNMLGEIAYFFKNDLYEGEKELRIVLKGTGFDKCVDLPTKGEDGAKEYSLRKVYIETVALIPIIRKLTIGPKVDRKEEWASAFHYYLQKERAGMKIGDKDLLPVDIYISHLPFK